MRVDVRPAIILLGAAASIALAGCSGHTSGWKFWRSSTEPAADSTAAAPAAGPVVETARPASVAEAASVPTTEPATFGPRPELIDVHFDAGRVSVRRADVKALALAAGWLMEHPTALVMIEGHTDDLGSREENLMVGEKRATSIMKYLVGKGVSRERISLASYGPDRPLCMEPTDSCRAMNRRVRFLVKQP